MQKLKKRKPETILIGEDLYILWRDGHESHLDFYRLRCACPCAQCVNEVTGERQLDPQSISKTVTIRKCEYRGNYAIQIYWSDGHNTGVYSFRYLRELDESNFECLNIPETLVS